MLSVLYLETIDREKGVIRILVWEDTVAVTCELFSKLEFVNMILNN